MKKDYTHSKKKLGLRLTPSIYNKIKYISIKENKPINQIIESYLIKYIEKYEYINGSIENEKDYKEY